MATRPAPNKTNTFVLYATGRRAKDTVKRVHVVIFEHAREARSWLQSFAGNDLYPVGEILDHGDFKVKCSRMAELIDHGPSDYELPEQYRRWLLQFKYGVWEGTAAKPETPVASDGTTAVERAPKPERAAKAQRPPGYVTITELAATWGVPGMIARQALRASGRTKPEFGWAFDPKEVDAIKKLVVA